MTAFALSKPFLDVGLFTNRGDAMRAFYGGELGLAPIDVVEVEDGYRLHRYDAAGSALKINVLEEPLRPGPTGFRRIVLARPDVGKPVELKDPDGLPVLLVPPGELGVDQLGIVWAVPSLERARAFASDALGAPAIAPDRFRFGRSTILFEEEASLPRTAAMEAIGFTYTTFHVRDVLATHARLLAAGCLEAIRPTPFHGITTYSFIRDPFGNWVEVSQRADLVGSFAEVEGPHLDEAEIRSIRRRG